MIIKPMKKRITILLYVSLAFISKTAYTQEVADTICWDEASTIEEALSLSEKDSCRIALYINEYSSKIASTLVIDKSLSQCKNIGIFGVGTTRHLKIKSDFSSFRFLEEFGIGGRIKKNVVNRSIKKSINLERVGIGYLDRNYIFPDFLNHLANDSVRVLLEYHFEDINIKKCTKNLLRFLKKTPIKRVAMFTLKGLSLNEKKEELLKDKRFKRIVNITREKKIQLAFFGIVVGYNYDAAVPGYIN